MKISKADCGRAALAGTSLLLIEALVCRAVKGRFFAYPIAQASSALLFGGAVLWLTAPAEKKPTVPLTFIDRVKREMGEQTFETWWCELPETTQNERACALIKGGKAEWQKLVIEKGPKLAVLDSMETWLADAGLFAAAVERLKRVESMPDPNATYICFDWRWLSYAIWSGNTSTELLKVALEFWHVQLEVPPTHQQEWLKQFHKVCEKTKGFAVALLKDPQPYLKEYPDKRLEAFARCVSCARDRRSGLLNKADIALCADLIARLIPYADCGRGIAYLDSNRDLTPNRALTEHPQFVSAWLSAMDELWQFESLRPKLQKEYSYALSLMELRPPIPQLAGIVDRLTTEGWERKEVILQPYLEELHKNGELVEHQNCSSRRLGPLIRSICRSELKIGTGGVVAKGRGNIDGPQSNNVVINGEVVDLAGPIELKRMLELANMCGDGLWPEVQPELARRLQDLKGLVEKPEMAPQGKRVILRPFGVGELPSFEGLPECRRLQKELDELKTAGQSAE